MTYHVQPASGVKNLHTTIGSALSSCEYSAGSVLSTFLVRSFISFHLQSQGVIPLLLVANLRLATNWQSNYAQSSGSGNGSIQSRKCFL
jgi:hypothetical protein